MSDNSRFLDIIGKCAIIQGPFNSKFAYSLRSNTSYSEQLIRNLNNDEFINDVSTFKGFFHNLSKLNTDKILKETEFIVGLYGDIDIIKTKSLWNCSPQNLFVITNRLNLFSCENILGHPRYADFNDVYELKLHQTNNFTLKLQQIQLINAAFHSVKLNFKTHEPYTKYTFMDPLAYDAYCDKHKYMEFCNKYNNSLPDNCGVETSSNENCCHNCFENRKKQLKIFSVKSIEKYSDEKQVSPTNQFTNECSKLYERMSNFMMTTPITKIVKDKEIESQLKYYKLNNTILKNNEEELDDEIC